MSDIYNSNWLFSVRYTRAKTEEKSQWEDSWYICIQKLGMNQFTTWMNNSGFSGHWIREK